MVIEEKIESIAEEAGKKILSFYDDPIDVTQKSDDSPLTKADLAAHHFIVDKLKELTPNIPIISEESGVPEYDERKDWQQYWLVDPLDGTKEFIKKNGEFTVNIALIENNIPVLGVVHIPATGITFVGSKDKGAWKIDTNSIKNTLTSIVPNLSKPLRVVCSRSHGSDDLESKLLDLGITVGEKVPAGSSLKFCLVAEGTADVYPRMGPTMEWDTAAGDAVFRYSGKEKPRFSPLKYNKENMLNDAFIIGNH